MALDKGITSNRRKRQEESLMLEDNRPVDLMKLAQERMQEDDASMQGLDISGEGLSKGLSMGLDAMKEMVLADAIGKSAVYKPTAIPQARSEDLLKARRSAIMDIMKRY